MIKFSPYQEITIDMVEGSVPGESKSDATRAVNPGDVDLVSLARRLQQRDDTPPVGYVPGKTILRDQVIDELDCSIETAETLVDALEARGFVRFTGSRQQFELEPSAWEIVLNPTPEER